MMEMAGRPGTSGGLVLRAGQFVFAAACICAMASAPGFTNYTSFCYLIASMGLQALWSLLCLDTEKGSTAGFFHEPICCWRLGGPEEEHLTPEEPEYDYDFVDHSAWSYARDEEEFDPNFDSYYDD